MAVAATVPDRVGREAGGPTTGASVPNRTRAAGRPSRRSAAGPWTSTGPTTIGHPMVARQGSAAVVSPAGASAVVVVDEVVVLVAPPSSTSRRSASRSLARASSTLSW